MDMAIHHLFKDGEGFQIAPQHLRAGYHGKPKWTVFNLIRAGMIPVCVIEIKLYCDLKRPQAQVSVYRQVEEHLKVLVINDYPIPTMYGVSVIGEQFLIMTMKTRTGVITPALNNNPDRAHRNHPCSFMAQPGPQVIWFLQADGDGDEYQGALQEFPTCCPSGYFADQ
ncbi:hypothetical protein K439DRAFT_1614559 [Ramaria rubella]|nr:hypothetical protein K439DRAFT_1614559 [Ramaria rubella]